MERVRGGIANRVLEIKINVVRMRKQPSRVAFWTKGYELTTCGCEGNKRGNGYNGRKAIIGERNNKGRKATKRGIGGKECNYKGGGNT